MVKSELIVILNERLSKRKVPLSLSDIKEATTIILEGMKQAILKKQRIEIRGFGSFHLSYHCARICRNPKTGQAVETPEKYTLRFKVGKALHDLVNHT
jgi:integration host factor subunit beta